MHLSLKWKHHFSWNESITVLFHKSAELWTSFLTFKSGPPQKSSHCPTWPVLGNQLIQCCIAKFARNIKVLWNINVYFIIIKHALFTEPHITPQITLFIAYLHLLLGNHHQLVSLFTTTSLPLISRWRRRICSKSVNAKATR